jgi:hypothetical protein
MSLPRTAPNPYEAPGCQEAKFSQERNLFRFFCANEAGVWKRGLTSFPRAGADDTCLHHTRIEVLSSQGDDCTELVVVLCDLETYQCPRTVLVKEVAEQ